MNCALKSSQRLKRYFLFLFTFAVIRPVPFHTLHPTCSTCGQQKWYWYACFHWTKWNETWQMLAELTLGIYLRNACIIRKPTAFSPGAIAAPGRGSRTGHGYRWEEWSKKSFSFPRIIWIIICKISPINRHRLFLKNPRMNKQTNTFPLKTETQPRCHWFSLSCVTERKDRWSST